MIVGPDRKSQEERRILTSASHRARTPPAQNIIALVVVCTLLAVIMLAVTICGIVFNPY